MVTICRTRSVKLAAVLAAKSDFYKPATPAAPPEFDDAARRQVRTTSQNAKQRVGKFHFCARVSMVARRVKAWSGRIMAITSPECSTQKLRPNADSARSNKEVSAVWTSNVRVKGLVFCAAATVSPSWFRVQCPLNIPCLRISNGSSSAVIVPCSPSQLNSKLAWCVWPSKKKSQEHNPFGLQCIMVRPRSCRAAFYSSSRCHTWIGSYCLINAPTADSCSRRTRRIAASPAESSTTSTKKSVMPPPYPPPVTPPRLPASKATARPRWIA